MRLPLIATRDHPWKPLMPKKHTLEDFIRLARERHGDRYDYSLVVIGETAAPVTIICAVHGPFIQKRANHLIGRGCPVCGRDGRSAPWHSPIVRDLSLDALIARRLRRARSALRLSLAQLAVRTRTLNKSRITNYEQGVRRMSIEAARELADALGTVSAAYLLGVDEETESARRNAD